MENVDVKKMMEENINLTYSTLNKYFFQYRNDEDFQELALIGLWEACKTFDENKKNSFSTYAVKCIKNRILNEIKKDRELSNNIEIVSLDNPITADGKTTYKENFENHNLLRNVVNKEYDFKKAFESLTSEERKLFNYFLSDLSHSEIAKKYGASRQAIERKFKKIKRKMSKELGCENAWVRTQN